MTSRAHTREPKRGTKVKRCGMCGCADWGKARVVCPDCGARWRDGVGPFLIDTSSLPHVAPPSVHVPKSPAQALGEARQRIAWLEERITGKGHAGFEQELARLLAVTDGLSRIIDACQELIDDSSPEIDAEDNSTARFVPANTWQKFLERVGARIEKGGC